ncbi:hypothetical protein M0805_009829 [Coniferiporia weirii]|nr:hypothetical protein M0805_009829 [Coniferiporia weirii]
MVTLPPFQLSANTVTPVGGSTYTVETLGFAHWLDNGNNNNVSDGNPILAWSQKVPVTTNQMWKYLAYPTTNGDIVFTLQSVSTIDKEPSFNGLGGYVRVNSTDNTLVQGAEPFAWKLIEAAPTIYKISPFDDIFSFDGELVATDINSDIETSNPAANQVALQFDETSLPQLWTFNKL